MATRIIQLDLGNDEAREEVETRKHLFWKGHCIPFAAGAHRITGWEIIAIDGAELPLAHCGVRAPDGSIWDGRGLVTPALFAEGYGNITPDRYRVVTWEELRAAWPPIDLPTTERLVSQMYPDLPHLPTSDRSRNVVFMDAVEELSRQCNVWISAGRAMHTRPVIGEAFGEEAGYRGAQMDGIVTMDRMLSSDIERGPNHLPPLHQRFIVELATLSRQHGLWIRAGLPTTWPRLASLGRALLERAHYAIRQTDNGAGFLVDASCL